MTNPLIGHDVCIFNLTTLQTLSPKRTTGSNFYFTTPYYYDGLAYYGNETFVRCAEETKRYAECSSLHICVIQGSREQDFIQSEFPSKNIVVVSQPYDLTVRLSNDTCNVIANGRSLLLRDASKYASIDRRFVIGNKTLIAEPISVAARGNDREFLDVIEWVVNALFYGEEQGLTKNTSRCKNKTPLAGNVSDLNFMNAVYCVGNYGDLLPVRVGEMNHINNGTTGMLFATPFGDLDRDTDSAFVPGRALLDIIMERGYLRCGVVTHVEYTGDNISDSHELVGLGLMSSDYCRALAAAIFEGDDAAVKVIYFSENENSSVAALTTSEIDVLSGARVELKYDFASDSHVGFHFSEPYYYGA